MRKRERGFALVLTLAVLSIASLAMLGLARRSLITALQARRAEEDLQRRWGERTLRAHLHPAAEEVLAKCENEEREPRSSVSLSLRLGRVDFRCTVTDEQAKLNVNTLYQGLQGDRQNTLVALARFLKTSPAEIRLLPHPDGPQGRFESYGQIFPDRIPLEESSLLTCWGDGRVHIRRASDGVLREALRGALAAHEIDPLLEVRRSSPIPEKAASLCTDRSGAYGLWIVASNGRRSWTTWSVRDGARRFHFAW